MRTENNRLAFGPGSLEASCETMLLGRLGREIAGIYHDTLKSPLPPRLQELVDRLELLGDGPTPRQRERKAG